MSETPIYDEMVHDLAAFPADWLAEVNKGDTFTWLGEVEVTVTRVADDGSWADLACVHRAGGRWTKRQPLPLSPAFTPTAEDTPADP